MFSRQTSSLSIRVVDTSVYRSSTQPDLDIVVRRCVAISLSPRGPPRVYTRRPKSLQNRTLIVDQGSEGCVETISIKRYQGVEFNTGDDGHDTQLVESSGTLA